MLVLLFLSIITTGAGMYNVSNDVINNQMSSFTKTENNKINPSSPTTNIDWNITQKISMEKILLEIEVFDNSSDEVASAVTDILVQVQIYYLQDDRNNWEIKNENNYTSQLNDLSQSTKFQFSYIPSEIGLFKAEIYLFVNGSESLFLFNSDLTWDNINISLSLVTEDSDLDNKDDSLYVVTETELHAYEYTVELKIRYIENDAIVDQWILVDALYQRNFEFPTTFYALKSGQYAVEQAIFVWPDGIPHSNNIDNSPKIQIDFHDFGMIELDEVAEILNVHNEISIQDHSIGDGVPNCQDDFVLQYIIQFAFTEVPELQIDFQVHNIIKNTSIQTSELIDTREFRYVFFSGDSRQGIQMRQIDIRSDRNDFEGNVRDMEFLITVTDLDTQASISSIETIEYDINMCGSYLTSSVNEGQSNGVDNNSVSTDLDAFPRFLFLTSLVILVIFRKSYCVSCD